MEVVLRLLVYSENKMNLWRYGLVYDWEIRLNMNEEQLQKLEQVMLFVARIKV